MFDIVDTSGTGSAYPRMMMDMVPWD